MKRCLFLVVLILLSCTAIADVEKMAMTTESGSIHLLWWPKVDPPAGWHFDESASRHHAFKAFAPDGSIFANAETVMYAEAMYKPRMPEIGSLDALMERDISNFAAHKVKAARKESLLSGDGKTFQVIAFSPEADGNGNWECVAFGEEEDKEGNEYFILFVVSSRTKDGLADAMSAYQSLISSYKTIEP